MGREDQRSRRQGRVIGLLELQGYILTASKPGWTGFLRGGANRSAAAEQTAPPPRTPQPGAAQAAAARALRPAAESAAGPGPPLHLLIVALVSRFKKI